MIKELRLLLIKVHPRHELQCIIIPAEKHLRALLVLIRLAQDLRCVYPQLVVARPVTVDDVVLYEIPGSPVIVRVLCLCATAIVVRFAAHVADPDKVVASRLEAEDLRTEGVGWRRGVVGIPETTCVCCVVELVSVGDEVRSVTAVWVHVKC